MEAQSHLVMWLHPGFFLATPHPRPYPCGVMGVWALLRVYLGVEPTLPQVGLLYGWMCKKGWLSYPTSLRAPERYWAP